MVAASSNRYTRATWKNPPDPYCVIKFEPVKLLFRAIEEKKKKLFLAVKVTASVFYALSLSSLKKTSKAKREERKVILERYSADCVLDEMR